MFFALFTILIKGLSVYIIYFLNSYLVRKIFHIKENNVC